MHFRGHFIGAVVLLGIVTAVHGSDPAGKKDVTQPAKADSAAPTATAAVPAKTTFRASPDGEFLLLEVDGQEKLRVHANLARSLMFELLNCDHNIYIGEQAGKKSGAEAKWNVCIGSFAGILNVQGKGNTFLGFRAGSYNRASQNTCIGSSCGTKLGLGENNAFVGYAAGAHVGSGSHNTLLGSHAAGALGSGSDNVVIGFQAGSTMRDSQKSVLIGAGAGFRNVSGKGNVFIGHNAGLEERGDNRLYIENSRSDHPLIYGEFDRRRVGINGSLGIGTQHPSAELHVVQGIQHLSDGLKIETVGKLRAWRLFLDAKSGSLLQFFQTTVPGGKAVPVAAVQSATGRLLPSADARHQKNADALTNVTEKLMRLIPQRFHFTWQPDTESKQLGIAAQEIQAVFPELVTHERLTDTFVVDYAGLSVLALRAVQEQQDQLRHQQDRIVQLEKQTAAMLDRLKRLEMATQK